MIASLACAAATGCGGSDSAEKPTPAVQRPERLLTAGEVAKQPGGSAERTVLQWWRYLQYDNAFAAARLYDPTANVSARSLNKLLEVASPFFTQRFPRVTGVERHADSSVVFLMLRHTSGAPGGPKVVVDEPRAVSLVRSGDGSWRLADNLLVQQIVLAARRK